MNTDYCELFFEFINSTLPFSLDGIRKFDYALTAILSNKNIHLSNHLSLELSEKVVELYFVDLKVLAIVGHINYSNRLKG